MSVSYRFAAQCCARQLRSPASVRASASLVQTRTAPMRRYNSTEAAPNAKITGIVDQISQLTLLETADLVASLKVGCLRTN